MSILNTTTEGVNIAKKYIRNVGNANYADIRLTPKEIEKTNVSGYSPSSEEREVRAMIIRQFSRGYETMWKPRREFNDLSVIGRMTVDQMAFNTYQPNNGEALDGDVINGWRSQAIRPIVRNKIISIAAHATAQLIFPKVFAWDAQSNAQENSAKVMEDLMEWAGEESKYYDTSMNAIISACVNPASIYYTEYGEVYRTVKKEKGEDGKWIPEKMLDKDLSGFKDTPVPVDELFIENFYESDIQKQGWLIWRRVIGYDLASVKCGHYPNFKYVKPGVQVIFNDANNTFYESYDNNMRTDSVEEIIYFNKKMDLKLIIMNGILLTNYDNPNPREDKLYPFVKFGYELMDEGKCFYYKSLAFKMQSDANIINTLYPMIIDGTYLNIFQPMINTGSEAIGSDVIIPGKVTNIVDPNSQIMPIQVAGNINAGMNTLMEVEKSINESSQEPIQNGMTPGNTTAYEISRLEQNANTVLGLFVKMIAQYVRQYGRLRIGDILQYMTIIDADKITDNPELVYKTFVLNGDGKFNQKKIQFTNDIPEEPLDEKTTLDHSYKVLEEQNRIGMEIYKVNPKLFRELCYQNVVSPDVMHPRSEDLERVMKLELYDRAIQNPLANQEKIFKDFLLGAYKEIKEPDEYVSEQQPMQPQDNTAGSVPSPFQNVKSVLPQDMALPSLQ